MVGSRPDLPEALRHTSSSVLQGEDPSAHEGEIPPPIVATTEEVEMWMQGSFRKLTNLSTKSHPEVVESVLWRGVKMGKHGQPSTKVEIFNGKVRWIDVQEDGELFLYINSLAAKEVRRVHISYVECPGPTDSWVVGDGGRCYRESEIRESFVEWVKCPQCTNRDRWFSSETAHRQHWYSIHRTS